MSRAKDREQFVMTMVKAFPKDAHRALRVAGLLMRHAKTHGRIQERWCSEEMSESLTRRVERREKQIEALITRHAESLGCKVHFDGDPRGYTVKLFLPTGDWNTWGGKESGYGVPQ